jgi:hypothetical protein
VDELTTRKLYNKLAQKRPMEAGALHSIITDGVWYPERANKRGTNEDGFCLICKCGKTKEEYSIYGGNVELATQ